MHLPLKVLAGAVAREHLVDHGLRLEDFGVLIAPAGGTKFLLLGGLDRVLFPAIRESHHDEPLHCIGASVGSFRLACMASRDPTNALERLAEAYIGIDERLARRRASEVVRAVLREILTGEGSRNIVDPPFARLHVLTNRCRGLTSSERRPLLLAGLGLAAAANFVDRRNLGWQFERVIFHSRGEAGPLHGIDDLPTQHAELTTDNLEAALLASAAVPLLVPGVTIPSHPSGIHRDAALLDYHPLPPVSDSPKLVLYPHFYEHLIPGWFDRSLPSRRVRGKILDRTVILTPSESFIASLPGGERPTRRDMFRFDRAERAKRWREVWERGTELGSAFAELLGSPAKVRKHVLPLR